LPGYIAKRNVTLLTGVAKFGKTTLLTQLLTRRKQGGTLAGRAVPAGKTIVITEESQILWAERARRHDFGSHVCFFVQPFQHLPSAKDWRDLVDRVALLVTRQTSCGTVSPSCRTRVVARSPDHWYLHRATNPTAGLPSFRRRKLRPSVEQGGRFNLCLICVPSVAEELSHRMAGERFWSTRERR
jgi:hypothetical protein